MGQPAQPRASPRDARHFRLREYDAWRPGAHDLPGVHRTRRLLRGPVRRQVRPSLVDRLGWHEALPDGSYKWARARALPGRLGQYPDGRRDEGGRFVDEAGGTAV